MPQNEIELSVSLNPDELTWEEVETIEAETGKVIGDLFPEGKTSALGAMGIYWLRLNESDPNITLADVRKMKISTVRAADPDPTTANGSKS